MAHVLERERLMSNQISKKHIRRFRGLCRRMQTLLNEIDADCPTVEIYIEGCGNWILMSGPTHDDNGKPLRENVVAYEKVNKSGGGRW